MSDEKPNEPQEAKDESNAFEQGNEGEQMSLVAEFIEFLKYNKKFWMIPLLISLLGLGVLIALGGTAAAPFIYTLF